MIVKKLVKWAKGGQAPPEKVQIYPTNKCNLNCQFCSLLNQNFNYNQELSKKRWIELTKEICEIGTEKILISGGGEPLMVPETTLEIMRIAKSHGLEGRIITNGTLWKKQSIENTIKTKWDKVVFSIDGPDAKTHDFLRGEEGCFKETTKNVKQFNETKINFRGEKPLLEINMVLCKHNYKKIIEMLELAHSLSINSINFEPVCVNNPEVLKIKLNKKERVEILENILPKAQKLAKKYKINTNFPRLKNLKYLEKTGKLKNMILEKDNKKEKNPFLNLPCYEPWIWPKIEADGSVWACSTVKIGENVKNKSFKEIWYGNKFKKFRKRLINRDLPSECENCVSTHLPINREIRKKLKGVI